MNVLIVEDNADDRRLLRHTLEHHGCTVIEARDGEEGLDLAICHHPDIIVSDALMPRMDGFQLLRALKADPHLKSIPFLFYSATYTGEQEVKLALSLGAEAFLVKPTEPGELWEKTRAIMNAWEARQRIPVNVNIIDTADDYLREYSRIVATKLEKKVRELEEVLALRKQAEDELRRLNAELTREAGERKRAESDVREQEHELATIFENAPFIMLLLDGERIVRRVNSLACLFTGSSNTEMIGRRGGEALRCLYALNSPEGCGSGVHCQKCEVRLAVTDTYETGQSHYQVEATLPFRIKGKEEQLTFLLSTTRVNVGNHPMVLLSIQDITELKKLEALFFQAQKMESIGIFAGGIAHDFNNILTAIIGYAGITLRKMSGDDPLRRNIKHVLAAAERGAHLTRDLLVFSSKQTSDKRSIDLNNIVRSVEKFLVRVIGEDIVCKTELHDKALPVFADAHQLEQVLMNLATNARDAMPKGGRFTLATEQVSFDKSFSTSHGLGDPGKYAVITASDTGKGMDEETRLRIFEPFYTTKEVGKGTGLGMSIIYGIVNQHDGFIRVYSEQGLGTTFRIYLPLIAAMADEVKMKLEAKPPGMGTETILFAEDDEVVREIGVEILQDSGYEVIVAVDGEDAVRKYRENGERIRLLVFDLIMPKKTGKEAYDEIREIEPDIKVIFASGYPTEIIRQQGLVDDNITLTCKPFSRTDLLHKVRVVLDGGKE
jgi:two-component system cell cycle sensor histidine kinase/response regulator CckA